MVASSEQQSAPVMVSSPATAQASSSQPGAPINRADSADVMKIPDPIIEPTTIMVASIGPRARTSCVFSRLIFGEGSGGSPNRHGSSLAIHLVEGDRGQSSPTCRVVFHAPARGSRHL